METIGTGLPVRTRRCRSGQRRGETVVSGWVWTEQRGEKRETAGDVHGKKCTSKRKCQRYTNFINEKFTMFKVKQRRKLVKGTTPDEGIWHRLPFAKPIRKFKINWISNMSHQLVKNIPSPTAFRILINMEMA